MAENWGRVLRCIPGYDPYETAGDCVFDEEAAELACGFFPDCLHHVKGEWAGKPIILEDWQKAVIGNLFGWKRPDGTRRYREGLLYVPRKNSKTTMGAGIVNLTFFGDREPGAEIYSAAGDRDQATLTYVPVREMIAMEPLLSEQCKVYAATKRILLNDNVSYYTAISADAGTKHGYNASVVIFDELHVQPNRELVDVLKTSMGTRRQPLMLYLTTADYKRQSICNEVYEYACKIRDGIIDNPAFLPIIYEATEKDDWTDEKVWAKANPNLGVSVKIDFLRSEYQKAQDSPQFENTFKRLYLNIQTETDVKFFDMQRWDACDERISEPSLSGRDCFAGFDLAANTDIAGYVLLFPRDDEKYVILPRLFIPKDNAYKRERQDRVPYTQWSRDGWLTMTPGNVIDFSFIKESFWADCSKFKISKCAFDRWGFEALRQQFLAEGAPEGMFIAFGQGYASMSAPTSELEKLVLAEKIIHNQNPVLRWMASNTVVQQDAAGNIKPAKDKSPEKIDGIVMTIMALGLAITEPPQQESVYEKRGFLSL